ncbi:hypothetical protein GcM3_098013 [Golovinomyces cichoracearum]|uniref:Uncharacterized protein n=1 Tax=Golovinomyces cichoracearum TaxID=62708 RepID=A0A420ICB0_9PEZI|nr:hypothetical protein GcM3_098013 [Golovinomyces cichoracearum]
MRVSQLKLILFTTMFGHMTVFSLIPEYLDAYGNSFKGVFCDTGRYLNHQIYSHVEKFRLEVKANPSLVRDSRFRSYLSPRRLIKDSLKMPPETENNGRYYFIPLMNQETVFSTEHVGKYTLEDLGVDRIVLSEDFEVLQIVTKSRLKDKFPLNTGKKYQGCIPENF